MSKKKASIPEEIQSAVSAGRPGSAMIVPERITPREEGIPSQVLWWLVTENRKFRIVALTLVLTLNGMTHAWDLFTLPFTIGLMQRNFEKKADVFTLWDAESRAIAIPGPEIGIELIAVCARTVKDDKAIPLAVRASFKELTGTSFWDMYEDPTTGIVDIKKDPRTVRLWQEELCATQEAVRKLLDAERKNNKSTSNQEKTAEKRKEKIEESEKK